MGRTLALEGSVWATDAPLTVSAAGSGEPGSKLERRRAGALIRTPVLPLSLFTMLLGVEVVGNRYGL